MMNRLPVAVAFGMTIFGMSFGALRPAAAQDANQRVSDIDFNITQLKTEAASAEQHLARVEQMYKAGQIAVSELDNARARLDKAQHELAGAMRDRQRAAGRAVFMRRVNLQVDHARIQDVARTLAKVAGITIAVDRGVGQDASAMVTMDVEGVPLAAVLESVAQKTDLMIAPEGDGVVLKRWPRMNGKVYHDPTAPWSAEWGVPPTVAMQGYMSGYFAPGSGNMGAGGQQSPGLPQAGQGAFNPFFGGPGAQQPGNNPFQPGAPGMNPGMGPPMGVMSPSMPISMVSLGDHLIAIAEPGVSERGEPGVWLTAYMFDNSGFHGMSRIFHPFAGQPGARMQPGGPPQAPRPRLPRSGEGASGSDRL